MEALQSVISLIITLGILVTIHEFGHFWVARRCGVKVLRFSVGFGKALYTWKDAQGTEFAVAAIPLGGYVKMLDEREGPVPEDMKAYAFNNKPVSQRIGIAAAGPIANFLFAIVAYWLMFLLGFSAILPKVGAVEDGSPAHEAGLASGQIITSVEGREAHSWREVIMGLVNQIGETGDIRLTTVEDLNDTAPNNYEIPVTDWMQDREDSDLLAGLGITPFRPSVPAVISLIQEGGAAEIAGMQAGDRILSVDGAPVLDWYAFVEVVQAGAGQVLQVGVLRSVENKDTELVLQVVPRSVTTESGTVGKIGVGVAPFSYPKELVTTISYGPIDAFSQASTQTWNDVTMTLGAIKKMLVGLISLDNLSGPITIARVANQSISTGLEEFLRFLALLSVSLGILNLLPIPVLDGGHILFYLVEAIRGKPLSERSQLIGLKVGMSLVLLLMVVAFYNDIMRL